MLVTQEQFLLIVFVLAVGVWLLDTSSGGSVITGDGQSDESAVGEVHLLLHQSFTERPTSDDRTAVVVLDGTGEDFRSGS